MTYDAHKLSDLARGEIERRYRCGPADCGRLCVCESASGSREPPEPSLSSVLSRILVRTRWFDVILDRVDFPIL